MSESPAERDLRLVERVLGSAFWWLFTLWLVLLTVAILWVSRGHWPSTPPWLGAIGLSVLAYGVTAIALCKRLPRPAAGCAVASLLLALALPVFFLFGQLRYFTRMDDPSLFEVSPGAILAGTLLNVTFGLLPPLLLLATLALPGWFRRWAVGRRFPTDPPPPPRSARSPSRSA